MSLRSMTGYARVRRGSPDGTVVVSVKTVNHRALDLHCHLPSELEPLEPEIRSAVKTHIQRGHVDVRMSLEYDRAGSQVHVNDGLLEAYLMAFQKAAARFGVSSTPDLNAVLRFPGVIQEHEDLVEDEAFVSAAREAIGEALEALNRTREAEGQELRAVMQRHLALIAQAAKEMTSLRERVLPWMQDRIKAKMSDMLQQANVEPQRVLQEAAFLADRSDIAEELSRLQIHVQRLGELLEQGVDVGKKIDFLMQEMNREANTILSKTASLGELGMEVTRLGLGVKADIEKIREQSLNVE